MDKLPEIPLDVPLAGTPAPHRRPAGAAPVPRWVAPVYLGLAALLLPWIIYLGVVLPDHTTAGHWDVAWTGFDGMEAVALIATAWFAFRRSTWVEVSAMATAVLLVVDAWFDCTTAHTGSQLTQAIVAAVVLELPLAGVSLWLARHAEQTNDAVTRWLVERSRRQSELLLRQHLDSGTDADHELSAVMLAREATDPEGVARESVAADAPAGHTVGEVTG